MICFGTMGRDQTRVLICAVASLALTAAGALALDWFQVTLDGIAAIDLRKIQLCGLDHACVSHPLTSLSGMFPTLAAVTLWSSLGFAALVAFQAGARLLTGTAHDAFTQLGYMLSLMAISLTVATAYMFGPEPEAVSLAIASQVVTSLHRTWAPLMLIAGLSVGFATIYLAVARESSDLGAAYKPITIAPERASDGRVGSVSVPAPAGRTPTSTLHAPGVPPGQTGVKRVASGPTGTPRAARVPTGATRTAGAETDPGLSATQPGVDMTSSRSRSGSLPPVPAHLRNQLHYIALTAELTGGGIDARREDGLRRLVLWRDVVGVVARRMPPEYDGTAFVDIISTAGSTLRIVPWTRLTGDPIEADGDARPRALIEHVVARCPAARLDPATLQFLDTGEPAQLPDLDTLRAHDDRLA